MLATENTKGKTRFTKLSKNRRKSLKFGLNSKTTVPLPCSNGGEKYATKIKLREYYSLWHCLSINV